jgi:carboxyl-terminal processing protease
MAWRCARLLAVYLVIFSAAAVPAAEVATKKSDQEAAARRKSDDEYYELYRAFADTMDQVERNYVKGISRRELMEAAIKGMLGKLDPHSSYISPDDLDRFKSSVDSQFGGIGIQVTLENGQLTVISPLVGSPAYEAGVQAGDRILEIEGKSTEGIDLDEAVRRMKGETGTSVTITVVHAAGGERKTLKINREVIHVETVLGDRRKADDRWDFMFDHDRRIGYIRITAFSRDTARDVEVALKELKKQNLRGLILDLRFNPGGLLTSAIEISDLFVAEGRIVSTEGRNSPERAWDARKPGTYEGFPIAVLINRYSASASEIVSACLQDHELAVVIGERSYGKGSVQNVIELEGGKSALKLTTAGYLRPSGKNIDRETAKGSGKADEWGVTPNEKYEIKLDDGEMLSLVTNRRKRDIVQVHGKSGDDKAAAAAEPESEFVDRQLQKAVDYLAERLAEEKAE